MSISTNTSEIEFSSDVASSVDTPLNFQETGSKVLPWLWLIGCFVLAGYFCWPDSNNGVAGVDAGAIEKSQQVSGNRSLLTKPIEQIVVGDRVLAHNPEISDAERESWVEPDFAGWLHLQLRMPKPDGSYLDINILRPNQWLEDNIVYITDDQRPVSVLQTIAADKSVAGNPEEEAKVDANVDDEIDSELENGLAAMSLLRPVYQTIAEQQLLYSLAGTPVVSLAVQMDLPELGLTDLAVITEINPAGEIKSGDGQVVTATFHHSSGDIIDLSIEANEGELETLGTTSNHPFWSVDKGEFIQAGSLELGERVLTYHGNTKRVVSKLARPGPEPVYNLEVHAEHTYFVGDGILVHNAKRYNRPKNEIFPGHQWSSLDGPMAQKPIVRAGPFNDAQRRAFLRGKPGGTKIAPHHRHQLSVEDHNGVIDELRGPFHLQGNNHTKLVGGVNRHPGASYFKQIVGGETKRAREIRNHFRNKGRRLVPHPTKPGLWIDPDGI